MAFKKTTFWGSTAVAALMITQTAFAQSETGSGAAAGQSDAGLGDIIVTARRTGENLQKVPVAASVVSSEALSRQGITTTRDLQYAVPSLVITPDPLGGSATPIIQLRGQTSPLGTDNTVVTYFGDVPVDTRVVAAGVFDLSAVQVIRGPQGTLFGKNSTGGAVVYTPQKATADVIKGFGEATVGNYDMRQVTGALNIPIVEDKLALRVSGQVTRQDGFAKNVADGPDGNDKHWEAGRAVLNFTPGGGFENDTVFTYFNGRQRVNPNIAEAISGFSLFFPQAVAGFALQQQLGPRKFSMSRNTAPNSDNNRSYLFSNATSYDFGGVTLKNIFGYSNTHIYVRMNQPAYDFNQIDVAQDRRIDQISDELQLSGLSFDDSLKWIVGGFYSKQKSELHQLSRLFSPTVNSVSDSLDEYTSKAVFGQTTYDFSNLGLTGLKLTGGLRHTWDDRVGSNLQNAPIPIQVKSKHLSWTVGLDYQVNDDVLLYVASRHSYKAGGFNLISPLLPPSSLVYAPEKLTDIEVGAKVRTDIGSVPVRANIALYRGWYKDIHVQTVGTCGGATGQSSLIINAGKGTPKGLELELEARLTPNLSVSGFYNRTLGKFDQFLLPNVPGCTLAAVPDLSGQSFGNISKDTAGLNAIYTIPLSGDGEELQLSGNMYYRSDRLGNDLRGYASPLPGYTLFNARLDYMHIGGTGFSLGAYIRNIGNKLYGVTRNDAPSAGYDVWQYGDPRTYGIVGKIEF